MEKAAIQKNNKTAHNTQQKPKIQAILRLSFSIIRTKYMYINSHSPSSQGSLNMFFERSAGRR